MDDTLYFCVCVLVVTKHFLTKVKEAASCRDPLCVITERKPSGDKDTHTHTHPSSLGLIILKGCCCFKLTGEFFCRSGHPSNK